MEEGSHWALGRLSRARIGELLIDCACFSLFAVFPVVVALSTNNISKKRKFVADGLFYAELNEFLQNELGEDGYAGVEVRVTPMRTEIIIRATRTQNVLGEKGRRIRELTSLVQKRFLFPEGNVELYAERVQNRALSAIAQAESLRFKLLGGLAVRRACYGVMRYVMENGAKGVEVVISGKLRAARAKAMKFRDGYMVKVSATQHMHSRGPDLFFSLFFLSPARHTLPLDLTHYGTVERNPGMAGTAYAGNEWLLMSLWLCCSSNSPVTPSSTTSTSPSVTSSSSRVSWVSR
jgi:ribosomal protein uS3